MVVMSQVQLHILYSINKGDKKISLMGSHLEEQKKIQWQLPSSSSQFWLGVLEPEGPSSVVQLSSPVGVSLITGLPLSQI